MNDAKQITPVLDENSFSKFYLNQHKLLLSRKRLPCVLIFDLYLQIYAHKEVKYG